MREMSDRIHVLFSSSTALGFNKIRDHCVAIQKIVVDYEQSKELEHAVRRMVAALTLAKSDLAALKVHMEQVVFEKSIVGGSISAVW